MSSPAVQIEHVDYAYGQRRALHDLSLTIERGETFAFLGPNGGGKSTLFRLLSTLVPPQQGQIGVLGFDARRAPAAIRRRLGIVFQSPGLDRKLTVLENLRCHAALYGLSGAAFRATWPDVLQRLGLTDRCHDRVEVLSGGLRRRVELAQSLLHRPELLLLDEPSTGLDPGARLDLWNYLRRLRDQFPMTIVLTTHLLEEADKADRLAILDSGRLVALGRPDDLRASLGGESLVLHATDPQPMMDDLRKQFGLAPRLVEDEIYLETSEGPRWLATLSETFGSRLRAITLRRPTLEEVFIAKTGHRFQTTNEAD